MAEKERHPFIRTNRRPEKKRQRGLTEIRAAYYAPFGVRYFQDLIDTMGRYIDAIKFAGGAFMLYPPQVLRELIDMAHAHEIEVSTGGFIEKVLPAGEEAVKAYLQHCSDLGFDIIELSSGFVTIGSDDMCLLVEDVVKAGFKAKAEVGIQFGAGGASSPEKLQQQGQKDIGQVLKEACAYLDAGAYMIMIESEGITEEVHEWRTDISAAFANALGLEKIMYEAADPKVFDHYVRTFGPDVNLFVDHSQIVQLECLRQGLWGTSDTWGKIVSYRPRS